MIAISREGLLGKGDYLFQGLLQFLRKKQIKI